MADTLFQSPTTVASRQAAAPVGVFDSGVGGLSVLREIRALLPAEHLLYFADSGYAPYGGRSEAEVVARSQAIAAQLLKQGAKAIVVACNTATAAAIDGIRAQYPGLPVVGVEPGLKPGAAASRNGKVGVLATENTLASRRFQALRDQVSASTGCTFHLMPCPGLADQIEHGELDSPATLALVRSFVMPLLAQDVDTLVLGCTHYPFVRDLIERLCGDRAITIIDTASAVARQLQRLLQSHGLTCDAGAQGSVQACTSGSTERLSGVMSRLLDFACPVSTATGAQ